MFAPNTDYIFYALTVLQPLTMKSNKYSIKEGLPWPDYSKHTNK